MIQHIDSTVFHHTSKVICLVHHTMDHNQQLIIIGHLFFYSFLNVALISENLNGILTITVNYFTRIAEPTNRLISGHEMFPDRLKNLHGYLHSTQI